MLLNFFIELMTTQGKISAPQFMGLVLCTTAIILAILKYDSSTLVALLSAGGSLLVGGSFEVYTAKRWGSGAKP